MPERPGRRFRDVAACEVVDSQRDDGRPVEVDHPVACGVHGGVEREEPDLVRTRERRGRRDPVVAPAVAVVVCTASVPDHVLVREHQPVSDHEPVGEIVEGNDLERTVEDVRAAELATLDERNLGSELLDAGDHRRVELMRSHHRDVGAGARKRADELEHLHLGACQRVSKAGPIDAYTGVVAPKPGAARARARLHGPGVILDAVRPMDETWAVEEKEELRDDRIGIGPLHRSRHESSGQLRLVGRKHEVVPADQHDPCPRPVDRRRWQARRERPRVVVDRDGGAGAVVRERLLEAGEHTAVEQRGV